MPGPPAQRASVFAEAVRHDASVRSTCLGIPEVPTELDEPVVVVDVLRAFTTAAWIVEGGASELVQATVARGTPPTDTLERVRRSRAAAGLRQGVAAGYPGVDEADGETLRLRAPSRL